jgi:putative transposase
MNSDRFADLAPAEIYATLLDEGSFLCSVRTMYRILAENGEVHERRNQLRHPAYHKPELLATQANQLWSWDITKLKGPGKWVYFYLYVIMDVFSRYVVGWMVASRENAQLARALIDGSIEKQGIQPGQLTLHADRGSPMKSKTVAELLVDLGVEKTHSRPHVSNDNPYSEAQFKTLKYDPDFPDRFGSLQHAREVCGPFFDWYNKDHRHSGIAFLTPEAVHYGHAPQILENRKTVIAAAYQLHPERFVRGQPKLPELPSEVWINPPTSGKEAMIITH